MNRACGLTVCVSRREKPAPASSRQRPPSRLTSGSVAQGSGHCRLKCKNICVPTTSLFSDVLDFPLRSQGGAGARGVQTR